MIVLNFQSKVLLPERLWKEAKNQEHLDELILEYMQRYPDYVVKYIESHFAVCERREQED